MSCGCGKPHIWRCRAVLLVFLAGSVSAPPQVGVLPKDNTHLKQVKDKKFHVGDIWEYKTRAGEEQSRLTIVRTDLSPELGIVVHVAVDNVRLANCHGQGPDSIPHMPFAKQALERSVTKKIGFARTLPAFEDGYSDWYLSFLKKKAGIYVVSVSDAVSVAEFTYRKGLGCEASGG